MIKTFPNSSYLIESERARSLPMCVVSQEYCLVLALSCTHFESQGKNVSLNISLYLPSLFLFPFSSKKKCKQTHVPAIHIVDKISSAIWVSSGPKAPGISGKTAS